MSDRSGTSLWTPLLGCLAVGATLITAFLLRLVDPLSNTVIPAEDPFTHMALIRQHVSSGVLLPLDDGTSLYPPGMHALLAAVWAYTGMDLYPLIRFAPVVLGVMGVLAMAVLLWRHAGPVAAFVGSLGYAVAPEVVFRTTMMSPTAVDLALLPVLLFAVLEIATGRMRWLAIAVPMTMFFVFMHPWILGILSIAIGVFFVLSWITMAFRGGRTVVPVHPFGLAATVAVIGVGLGVAMTGCDGYCGPGMKEFLPPFMSAGWMPAVLIAGSMAPLSAMAAIPHVRGYAWRWRLRDKGRLWVVEVVAPGHRRRAPVHRLRRIPPWFRLVMSLLIAASIFAFTYPAARGGMPQYVDLPRMLGWPLLLIGGFGLTLLTLRPNLLVFLGAGLVVATYPFVIYDVFDSEFWPHRTAVFFAIGLVILVGSAVGGALKWIQVLAVAFHAKTPRAHSQTSFSAFLAASGLLIVASTGGTVYAQTPEPYENGWYRLFPECEMDALRSIADHVEREDQVLVITGSWQARLVLIGLTGEPGKVWFDPGFIIEQERRESTLSWQKGPVHVILDRHMGEADITREHLGFLEDPVWAEHQAWCPGDDGSMRLVHRYSTA